MDAALTPLTNGTFDIALDGADLAHDEGLRTAVILSLFSDARAADDDAIPDGTAERRGWWADTFAPIAGDAFGSRQWLIGREKQTAAILLRAKEYAEESLRWLIDDGVARSVAATAYFVAPGVLGMEVAITRNNGAVASYRFDRFWGNP